MIFSTALLEETILEEKMKENICPICHYSNQPSSSMCSQCGYDNSSKEITDKDKLIGYLASIKKSKDWVKEVTIKKRVTELQIKKHGVSSTNPERGGWSITKTATLLGESKGVTSTDIKLAKALSDHPKLKYCRNKSEAMKQLHQINRGGFFSESPSNFEFEELLQEYLLKNWETSPFANEWVLQRPGLFNKGKYNTGEIGELDFLAKHKTDPKWLVIELKRNQTSDETVGQILRYMGWVKENRANNEEMVEGVIIAASADDRIRYALLCTPDIRLQIYHLKDGKLKLEEPESAYLDAKFKNKTPAQMEELLEKLLSIRQNRKKDKGEFETSRKSDKKNEDSNLHS